MNRILILSNNDKLTAGISADIREWGYNLFSLERKKWEPKSISEERPDLILFDITENKENNIEICQEIKTDKKLQRLELSLILMINEENCASLLNYKKYDDFIIIPYRRAELKTRIGRLLKQKDKIAGQQAIIIGNLAIYPSRYEVCVSGLPIELTYKEYELLKYLATRRGRAFSRESLLNTIWGYDYYGGTRTVDVHIRRIRAKVGDEYIKTVRGVGYMFKG